MLRCILFMLFIGSMAHGTDMSVVFSLIGMFPTVAFLCNDCDLDQSSHGTEYFRVEPPVTQASQNLKQKIQSYLRQMPGVKDDDVNTFNIRNRPSLQSHVSRNVSIAPHAKTLYLKNIKENPDNEIDRIQYMMCAHAMGLYYNWQRTAVHCGSTLCGALSYPLIGKCITDPHGNSASVGLMGAAIAQVFVKAGMHSWYQYYDQLQADQFALQQARDSDDIVAQMVILYDAKNQYDNMSLYNKALFQHLSHHQDRMALTQEYTHLRND